MLFKYLRLMIRHFFLPPWFREIYEGGYLSLPNVYGLVWRYINCKPLHDSSDAAVFLFSASRWLQLFRRVFIQLSSQHWIRVRGRKKTLLGWIPFLKCTEREWKIGTLSPDMLQELNVSSPWWPGFTLETCSVLSFVISADGGPE